MRLHIVIKTHFDKKCLTEKKDDSEEIDTSGDQQAREPSLNENGIIHNKVDVSMKEDECVWKV